jgi:hypothetical protein
MISQQRSGIPNTQIVQADSDGVCVRLQAWSSSITIACKSAVRIYWTQKDFDADKNGTDLSGDQQDDLLSINANAANVWVKGIGGAANVTITSIGIG